MRLFLIIIFASLYLVSCETGMKLKEDGLYLCETEAFVGYVEASEYGHYLYVDKNHLRQISSKVKIEERADGIYIIGESIGEQRCVKFEEYSNPGVREIGDSCTYDKEGIYDYNIQSDIPYSHAMGYWKSYPENGSPYIDTFLDRAEQLFDYKKDSVLTLDVYVPNDGNDHSRPLLVMIHGGAFYNGDKAGEEYVKWCEKFASSGYCAVSINYRLGFSPNRYALERAAYRALQDVNAAIRYMTSNEEYLIDPNSVFLSGCSAGAITALNAAFMENKDRGPETRGEKTFSIFDDTDDLGDIESLPLNIEDKHVFKQVRAVGNMWGAISNDSILANKRVHVISFHDTADPVVPYNIDYPFVKTVNQGGIGEILARLFAKGLQIKKYYGSAIINGEMQKFGLMHELVPFYTKHHTVIRDPESNELNAYHQEIFDKMLAFFKKTLAPTPTLQYVDSEEVAGVFEFSESDQVTECSWEVENGVVIDVIGPGKVRVMIFDSPGTGLSYGRINYRGKMKNGLYFEGSYDVKPDSFYLKK